MAAVFLPVAGTPRCHRTSDSAAGLEPPLLGVMRTFGCVRPCYPQGSVLPSGISATSRTRVCSEGNSAQRRFQSLEQHLKVAVSPSLEIDI